VTRLATYHLAWALVMLVVTGIVLGYAVSQWLKLGQPPVYQFWMQQLIVVCGAYRFNYHLGAFNRANKK